MRESRGTPTRNIAAFLILYSARSPSRSAPLATRTRAMCSTARGNHDPTSAGAISAMRIPPILLPLGRGTYILVDCGSMCEWGG